VKIDEATEGWKAYVAERHALEAKNRHPLKAARLARKAEEKNKERRCRLSQTWRADSYPEGEFGEIAACFVGPRER
jgi:hypothetical protein